MPVSDFCFIGDRIAKKKRKRERMQLVSASFTAWQILRIAYGYKCDWKTHIRDLGLTIPDEESDEEARETEETALRILERQKRNEKNFRTVRHGRRSRYVRSKKGIKRP
ncbi:MAG: hypothetical protein KJN62_00300 [Deltaproteobacteria bacterium]|nr:hypothetical protein [Deltaproteobacteria bacterium]